MGEKYDHANTDSTISTGYWRKQVYDWLDKAGFKITDEQQRELSHLLKEMVNAKTKDLQERLVKLNNKQQD